MSPAESRPSGLIGRPRPSNGTQSAGAVTYSSVEPLWWEARAFSVPLAAIARLTASGEPAGLMAGRPMTPSPIFLCFSCWESSEPDCSQSSTRMVLV